MISLIMIYLIEMVEPKLLSGLEIEDFVYIYIIIYISYISEIIIRE